MDNKSQRQTDRHNEDDVLRYNVTKSCYLFRTSVWLNYHLIYNNLNLFNVIELPIDYLLFIVRSAKKISHVYLICFTPCIKTVA